MPVLHETAAASSLIRPASTIASLPILILNAHSLCNCRCVMCDIWKREKKEQIRAEDLERHRDSMQKLGVRHVVLTGGEPLLHNDLAALCNFLREQKIHLTLLTTGLLLLKRAEEVAALFDDVIASIDGPEEIHNGIRRIKGAYDLIRRGVTAVRSHNPSLPMTCRTTVQKANHRHLLVTVDAVKELGLDSVSFLAADLTSEAFNRPLLWPGEKQSQIGLTNDETTALEIEIELLIQRYETDIRSKFIVESPAKLRRIPRHFRQHLGQIHPEAPACNAPWVSAVVEIDGSVRPCFFHRSIGNITASTLEEVVNGIAAREFRQSLDVTTNATCQRCVCSLNYRQSQQ
ncbi:radical SAM protein [Tunturiibacter lichenicola]|uniref:radical SAM protein n=1 Tax=Tunturiibacter lichenicola TaxID=2051959 RepID=UPI0021B33199|nr:radical SAM protein [Edaphobacter lichenicola]